MRIPALGRETSIFVRRSLWLLVLLWPFSLRASEPNRDMEPLSLRVGFTRYAFSNVDRNDAEAAFKVFIQIAARKRGYEITSTTQVFDDAADFESGIKAGRISLAIIDTWRYLGMDIHDLVTPVYVTASQQTVGKRYVVLTRRESGLDRLDDLRGRELVEIEVTNANLGRSWLETLLLSRGLGDQTSFFRRVESVNKASAAVLPVFFGQRDACLVDESSFEVMYELNPQVGRELYAIQTSEPLVDGMICIRNDGWPSEQHKRDVIEALGELQTEPAGQQILTLFKIGRLAAFAEPQLESVRELWTTNARLRSVAER